MDNQNHNDLSDIIAELHDLHDNWYGTHESKLSLIRIRIQLLQIMTYEQIGK